MHLIAVDRSIRIRRVQWSSFIASCCFVFVPIQTGTSISTSAGAGVGAGASTDTSVCAAVRTVRPLHYLK